MTLNNKNANYCQNGLAESLRLFFRRILLLECFANSLPSVLYVAETRYTCTGLTKLPSPTPLVASTRQHLANLCSYLFT